MSEKIIIDGVNVAKCQHLKECKDRKNPRCLLFDEKCWRIGFDDNYEDICYYKQLQRLKQDNEELIGKNNWFCEQLEIRSKTLEQLRQTLEEIKKSLLDGCSTCMQNCYDCLTDKILFKINEVLND